MRIKIDLLHPLRFGCSHIGDGWVVHLGPVCLTLGEPIVKTDFTQGAFVVDFIDTTVIVVYREACLVYFNLYTLLFGPLEHCFEPLTAPAHMSTEYDRPYQIRQGRYAYMRVRLFNIFKHMPFFLKRAFEVNAYCLSMDQTLTFYIGERHKVDELVDIAATHRLV